MVLAAVIAVVCLRRRKSPAGPAAAPVEAGPEDDGIYLRLEVVQGAYLGQSLDLTLSLELVVGRDPDCGLPFGDGSVSRRHSRIFLANGAVYIEDLGSQNGTFVNGTRLDLARLLRSGDEIRAGDVVFKLKF